MIKLDHDEIMKWYGIMQDFKESGLAQKQFCDAAKIDYKKFCNMRYRIISRSETNPDWYAKNVPIARRYMASDLIASKFSKANGISLGHLSELTTHLGYLDIIESRLGGKETENPQPPMTFLKVPTVNLPFIQPREAEIVEARNDIELVITKGVKVIVSPELGTDKLIKIIELLKDL